MPPDIYSTGVIDTQREDIRITLRMPAEVAEGMKLSAHENDRSLNGEIVLVCGRCENIAPNGTEPSSRECAERTQDLPGETQANARPRAGA